MINIDFDGFFDPPIFSTPYLVVWDSARLLVILASLALLYLLVRCIFIGRNLAVRLLLTSSAFALFLTMETQVELLGETPVSWRFFVAMFTVAPGLYGAFRYVYRGDGLNWTYTPEMDDDDDNV